jgi:hypothetical protein
MVDETGKFQKATASEVIRTAGRHPDESEVQQLIGKVVERLKEVEFTPDTGEFCRPVATTVNVPVRLKYQTGAGWAFVSRLGR